MRIARWTKWVVPPWRRIVMLLVAFAVTGLLMWLGLADKLILHPSTQPMPVPGVTRLMVEGGGGQTVEIWTARSYPGSEPPTAYCLAFVGNAARAEISAAVVADEWGARRVEVWAVNYPGYGGSPGPATMKSIPPAALAAYTALAARAGGKPIFAVGESLGSAAALYVAANRPCAGVVLTNPPPLRNMILNRFGWWNLWLVAGPAALAVPAELNSLDTAPRCLMPAVFVLAGRDSVVPPKYQTKVFDAYAGDKRAVRVPDADHNDPRDAASDEAFDEAIDWLWTRAGLAPSKP